MFIQFQDASWQKITVFIVVGFLLGCAAIALLINGGLWIGRLTTTVQQQEACDSRAFDWAEKSYQSNVLEPVNFDVHARRYQAYKSACPSGHVLVNEAIVPEQIKQYRATR
jgi:hypothetical protein